MDTIFKIFFFVCLCTNLFAQENLIPNPGFENTVKCNSGQVSEKIANWKYTSDGIGGGRFPASDTCSNLLLPINNNFS